MKGRLPGHARWTESGPGSCSQFLASSLCKLQLPRASPSTHVHVHMGGGPAEGPQYVSGIETTAGMLCALMCATGRQAGARMRVCTHSMGARAHWGSLAESAHAVCKCAALVDTCTCKETCVPPAAWWTSAGQPPGSPGDHSPDRACRWAPSPHSKDLTPGKEGSREGWVLRAPQTCPAEALRLQKWGAWLPPLIAKPLGGGPSAQS